MSEVNEYEITNLKDKIIPKYFQKKIKQEISENIEEGDFEIKHVKSNGHQNNLLIIL